MASTQKKPEKTKQTAAGKKSGGAKSQTKHPSQGKGKAASTASRRKPRAYMPNVLARGIAAAVCAFLKRTSTCISLLEPTGRILRSCRARSNCICTS